MSWLSFILRGKSNAKMVWCIEVESICAGKPPFHSLNAFILPKIGLYSAVAWHVAPVLVLKWVGTIYFKKCERTLWQMKLWVPKCHKIPELNLSETQVSTLCTGFMNKSLTIQPDSGISSLSYSRIPSLLEFTVEASKTSLASSVVIMAGVQK